VRKDGSKFITKYISEAGSFTKNRDFGGFVTLDNYACWIIVDGIDSSDEKLSAEMAVSSIISDFTTKPGFSKGLMKKYIQNANTILNEFTGKSRLSASIVMVISDYKKIMYGYAGNARFYHLRKDRVLRKTKDHSIAMLMADVGDIEKNLVDTHKERNTLYKFLGEKDKIEPEISGKIRVMGDDVFVLSSSGVWENLKEKELEEILKGSMDIGEFVENVEDVIKEHDGQNLNNYSIMAVFAEKLFNEAEAKKKAAAEKPPKKINFDFLKKPIVKKILIALLIMAVGLTLLGIKKNRDKKVAKAKQETEIKNADKQVDAGENYDATLQEYEKAKEVYKNDPEKLKELDAKIEKVKSAMAGEKAEKEGDINFNKKNYDAAEADYMEALSNYEKAEIDKKSEVEEKLETVKGYGKIAALEKSGDNSFAKQNYETALKTYQNLVSEVDPEKFKDVVSRVQQKIKSINEIDDAIELEIAAEKLAKMEKYDQAISKYRSALAVYSDNGIEQKKREINKKLEEIEQIQLYGDVMKEAAELEEAGDDEITKKNFEKAEEKYNAAYKKYMKIENSEKQVEIKAKIDGIEPKKKYEGGKGFEAEGDSKFSDKKYDAAIESYENAKKIFNELNQPEDYSRVDEKIKKSKKKKKILGII